MGSAPFYLLFLFVVSTVRVTRGVVCCRRRGERQRGRRRRPLDAAQGERGARPARTLVRRPPAAVALTPLTLPASPPRRCPQGLRAQYACQIE